MTTPVTRQKDRNIKVRGSKVEAADPSVTATDIAWLDNNNAVITSKYKWYNFLPKNLFEQFNSVANLYFLFIGILQIIPLITTTDQIPTMYEPLAFIVFVSAVRAASEDYGRHQTDKQRNRKQYLVLGDNGFEPIASEDLTPGRIVKLRQNEMIPADLLLVGSALDKGFCFIDKANLNGETTLEVLSAPTATASICTGDKAMQEFSCSLSYEPPNRKFDSLRGTMMLQQAFQAQPVEVTLTGKYLLMRETNLRNCEFIYGIVLYTGNDTKIQRSNLEGEKPRVKQSQIMRQVQRFLKLLLVLEIFLCAFGAVYSSIWMRTHTEHWYLFLGDADIDLEAVAAFFSWFILLSQFVPISLSVTAEFVKFIQSQFLEWDMHMYYAPINKPVKCNTSTIHEDLGNVDYVFSDKTGTLTQNKMEFRYALLEHGGYGSKDTEIARAVRERQRDLQTRLSAQSSESKQANENKQAPLPWPIAAEILAERAQGVPQSGVDCCTGSICSPCWHTPREAQNIDESTLPKAENIFTEQERKELLSAAWGNKPASLQGSVSDDQWHARQLAIRVYLNHLCLSNTVKPYEQDGQLKYQADSSEELAMVNFARSMGFTKRSQNPTVVDVTEWNADLTASKTKSVRYNHLATLGFTSQRARVTIIYQRLDDSKIIVMTTGSDGTVLPLLVACPNKDELGLELNRLGTDGLRTMVCGESELDSSWWDQRSAAYKQAITMPESEFSQGHSDKRCVKAKCEKCAQDACFQKLETDAKLSYVGCLGLEDQLQSFVPETIKDCLRADMKVWMITGDKLETAKSIGLACNLIDSDMPPSFNPSMSLTDCIKAYQNSRLIEISGQWATVAERQEELEQLFDAFDTNGDGQVDLAELEFFLKALRYSYTSADLAQLMQSAREMLTVTEMKLDVKSSGLASSNWDGSEKKGLDKQAFVALFKHAKPSMYEAIKFEVSEGIKRYNSIPPEQRSLYPVSILVNKTAFDVMYPEKSVSTTPKQGEPSQAELTALRNNFFNLAIRSKSVVFSRAQPAMKKRMVVEIQQRLPSAITLAIGDGANDTDMIQAAHVGVGISGREGTAAANAADYSVGTFRFLHTLLFVHGFWSNQRLTKMVHFIFYKAALIAVTGFYFGFATGFSGLQLYNDPPMQFLNVVITAFPIGMIAIFDQALPRRVCQANPLAFQQGKGSFTVNSFAAWTWRSFWHSAIIFVFPYLMQGGYANDVAGSDGRPFGLWSQSLIVFVCVALLPTFLVLFEMHTINLFHWITVFISVASLFLVTWLFTLPLAYNPDVYQEFPNTFGKASTWLVILFTVSLPLLAELAWRTWETMKHPSFVDLLRERMRVYREETRKPVHHKPILITEASERKLSDDRAASLAEAVKQANANQANQTANANNTSTLLPTLTATKPTGLKRSSTVSSSLHLDTIPEDRQPALKLAFIRAMLRFKNMAAGQQGSINQHLFQKHDPAQGENRLRQNSITPPLVRIHAQGS